MRGFGLQRQRPVADQLRIAAVLLRKIGRWMPQYAAYLRLLSDQHCIHINRSNNLYQKITVNGHNYQSNNL